MIYNISKALFERKGYFSHDTLLAILVKYYEQLYKIY